VRELFLLIVDLLLGLKVLGNLKPCIQKKEKNRISNAPFYIKEV
jgi:hypothetical protein